MAMKFYCLICGGKAFQYTSEGIPACCRERNFCHPTTTGKCCPKKEACPNWRVFHHIHSTDKANEKKPKQKSIHMSF